MSIDPKYLKEYRCSTCQRLLCKGIMLLREGTYLEVKCRGCHKVVIFAGPDMEVIESRAELIKRGLIPDTDLLPVGGFGRKHWFVIIGVLVIALTIWSVIYYHILDIIGVF